LRHLTDNPHDHEVQQQVAQVDAYVRKVGAVSTIKAILNHAGIAQMGSPLLPQLAHPDAARAYAEFKAIGPHTS
jgi:dihydrodipicolinate synthase/N-acetylneuraminate lyase